MTIETLLLKEINLLPELFLGISLIYLVLHGTFLSVSKNYPIIQTSFLYLGVLTLIMVCFLLTNDGLDVIESSNYNNTILTDYLSFSSKILIGIASIFCFLMIQQYLVEQRLNHFEYILLLLFASLGLFLLCSANDLITAYLAIELQSLSFYVMAAFKKNSTFSVEAGLKYFILGAFSSSLFLFGSSLIYGLTGSTNLEDFKDLFFWIFPGSIAALSKLNNYYSEQSQNILLNAIINKLKTFESRHLLENDFKAILIEFSNIDDNLKNELKTELYEILNAAIIWSLQDSILVQKLDYNVSAIYQEEIVLLSKICLLTELMKYYVLTLINNTMLGSDEQMYITEYQTNHDKYLNALNFFGICSRLDLCVRLDDYQEKIYFFQPFDSNLLKFALIFLLISLFFKLALSPFHLWSPDVYEGSPSSSTFFFAVIPKLGLFILLLRIFYYSFYGFVDSWRYFVVIIAVISIVVGSFVGLEQRKLKSLLAYSSISHMGYSLIAFASGTFEGIQMLFCYLIIYMCSGLCIWSIFLLTRLKNNYLKKQNKELTDLVLLRKSNSILAIFFSTVLLSVAGFPPMIGFFVKVGVFLVSIEASMYFIAFISILCSVISTFYYIRIIKIIYFEKVLVGKLYYPINTRKSFLVVLLFYCFIFLFINPNVLYLFSYKISLLSLVTTF